MTIKTRRILLIMAVLIFLAVGSVLLVYARGYRWDFSSNKFVLSGAIYIESAQPKETNISLNDKLDTQSGSTLIKSLLPSKKYKINISKDGFQTWEKEFSVEAGLVTNTKNVVLFPKQLSSQIVWAGTTGLSDFTISPDEKNIAIRINSNKILIRDLTNINATSTELKFPDKSKTQAVAFAENNESWSKNSQKIIIWRKTTSAIGWYVYDISNNSFTNLTSLYEKKLILKNPSPTPLPTKFVADRLAWFGENGIVALIKDKFILVDLKEETLTDLNFSDIYNFDVFENKIIAIKNPNIILMMDSAVQNISVLGETKFQNPSAIRFSPEGDKAVYADTNGKSLGVIWLKEVTNGQIRKANDQDIIYTSPADTVGLIGKEIYWHHLGEYILFNESQSFKTAEIDTRSNVNIASWPENQNVAKMVYLPKVSKLYILENSTIKVVNGEF